MSSTQAQTSSQSLIAQAEGYGDGDSSFLHVVRPIRWFPFLRSIFKKTIHLYSRPPWRRNPACWEEGIHPAALPSWTGENRRRDASCSPLSLPCVAALAGWTRERWTVEGSRPPPAAWIQPSPPPAFHLLEMWSRRWIICPAVTALSHSGRLSFSTRCREFCTF